MTEAEIDDIISYLINGKKYCGIVKKTEKEGLIVKAINGLNGYFWIEKKDIIDIDKSIHTGLIPYNAGLFYKNYTVKFDDEYYYSDKKKWYRTEPIEYSKYIMEKYEEYKDLVFLYSNYELILPTKNIHNYFTDEDMMMLSELRDVLATKNIILYDIPMGLSTDHGWDIISCILPEDYDHIHISINMFNYGIENGVLEFQHSINSDPDIKEFLDEYIGDRIEWSGYDDDIINICLSPVD